MSNRELPMMPWFPDQFAASTAGWTFKERAVYRALLDLQWQNGKISADFSRLSIAIGLGESPLKKCWKLVGPKFAAVEGGLQNHRLEEHRLAAIELRKKKVEAGRASGVSRRAQLKAVLEQTASSARTGVRTGVRTQDEPLSLSLRKEKLSRSSPAPTRKHAANGQGAAACPSTGETGAIREDDPDVRRKRKEAETLAAQHAAKKDDGMPF